MDNKERPVSIEAFINDPKNSDYINNVINRYSQVRLISNNSDYVIGDDEKVIEINKIGKDEYIEIFQDLFDNYHIDKIDINNSNNNRELYKD